jgi:hypothetical protein
MNGVHVDYEDDGKHQRSNGGMTHTFAIKKMRWPCGVALG